ncbi:uncharacterized protein LOC119683336 [Teleopsis dalmanni]|uniref:uncharacterized protein LOC119683336 n=1 Tax=Teleopsis dalmanni TaxID=139649 RepID=UPI0018CE0500|nr:uncharacterized protein LOC119683336 [Teleopsis dalmanni]XP_037952919.1 uncharacterized protein LOC119683336 [Teleopsis dalmanni]
MCQLTILDLNEDCLRYICKNLLLVDQLRFAATSKYIFNVVQMCSALKYKEFKLEQLMGLTFDEICIFLNTFGAYIESLSYFDIAFDLKQILEACKNIKYLYFDSIEISSKLTSVLDTLHHHKYLQKLVCENCTLEDEDIILLGKLTTLKCLNLRRNRRLTGKYLNEMVNVEELNLSYCMNLQSVHFVNVCKALKSLKKLNVEMCTRLTTSAFNEMVEYCPNLENLCISIQYNINNKSVAQLPKLTHLTIISAHTFPDAVGREPLFIALSKYKTEQLTHLYIEVGGFINYEAAKCISSLRGLKLLSCIICDISDECLRELCTLENLEHLVFVNSEATSSGLFCLLKTFKKLKILDVRVCVQINNSFIFDVIKLLRQEMLERALPLTIRLHGTSVKADILKDARFKDSSNLLQLCWEP